MKIKVFGPEDVDRTLSMAEAIDVVEGAFVQLSLGKARSPVRTALDLQDEGEVALIMPAFLGEPMALGTKMVTVLPKNPEHGRPAVQALVMLFDVLTGRPSAIFEGTHLTCFRTGAATGAATRVLSRPDCKSLALFGAGGQAFFQVEGVWAARNIRRVRIFDIIEARADSLVGLLKRSPFGREMEVLKASSPTEALAGADIVVTATNSNEPVFDGRDLREGVHLNAIGAFTPKMQEVDGETIRRSRVFVDSFEACLKEAGDLIIPLNKGLIQKSDILAELGEVIAGKKVGRRSPREVTFFKSVGNAVQDVAVAQAVLQKAEGKGFGREVEL